MNVDMTPTTPVVVCDLDSTLCDTSPRHHLQPSGPARKTSAGWVGYSLACHLDKPIPSTVALLRALHRTHDIVILSARAQVAQEASLKWLGDHGVPFNGLVLRADEEPDDPCEFKLDKLRKLKARREVVLAIDDYDVFCRRVWEELHIPALHVHQPAHYSQSLVGMPL